MDVYVIVALSCLALLVNARFFIFAQSLKKILISVIVCAVILGSITVPFLGVAEAAINPQINYQGKLGDSSGSTVTDGTYQIVFNLYTASSGGSPIWTETRSGANEVTVTKGLFSVLLGEVTALTGINWNQTLYLGVTIESDSEMTPRKKLGTVPSAFESQRLEGLASTSFIRSDTANATSTTNTALILTQNGAGDILNLFDGSNEVFSVLDGGNVGIGSTTPVSKLTVSGGDAWIDGFAKASYFVGTSTATSTFGGGLQSLALNVTGSATSTFAQGINIATGCFAVNGTCVGSGSSLSGGSPNTFAYWTSGSTLAATSSPTVGYIIATSSTASVFSNASTTELTVSSNAYFPGSGVWNASGFLGIGTTTPGAKLSVGSGDAIIDGFVKSSYFYATSTTATSTFAGGLTVGNSSVFRVLQNGKVGIGTTSPSSHLTVVGDVNITGALRANGNAGSLGYILQTNGTNMNWVDPTTIGLVSSVSNVDGTLSISPTSGAVIASLNLANNNTWTGTHIFSSGASFEGNVSFVTTGSPNYFTFGDTGGTNATISTAGEITAASINFTGSIYQNGSAPGLSNFTNDSGYLTSISGLNISSLTNDSGYLTSVDLATNVTGTLPIGNGGTGATSFTAGRVLFGNGSSAINTNANLFWDNTNSRLGIGTSTPGARLSVGSGDAIIDGFTRSSYFNATSTTATSTFAGGFSAASSLYALQGGNVGIGESSPATNLHIRNASNPAITIASGAYASGKDAMFFGVVTSSNAFVNTTVAGDTAILAKSGGTLHFGTGVDTSTVQASRLKIGPNGNVTINPAVSGTDLTLGNAYFNLNTSVPKLNFNSNGNTYYTNIFTGGDGVTGSLNIGRATSVGGSATALFTVLDSGNVGIGSTTPGAKLSVGSGDAIIDGFTKSSYFNATSTTATSTFAGGFSAASSLYALQGGNVGIGTSSPVAKLDVVGSINFASNSSLTQAGTTRIDGNGRFISTLGSVSSAGVQFSSDANTGIFSPSGDILAITTGGTERLRVDTTGNVGIGTTSPYAKFSVVGQVVGEYFTATSTTATSTFAGGFSAASSLYVLQGGNVGIGSTSPSSKLSVKSSGTGTGISLYVEDSAGAQILKQLDNGSFTIKSTAATIASFQQSTGNEMFGITSSGPRFNQAGGTTIAGGTDLGARFNLSPVNDSTPALAIRMTGGSTSDLVRVSSNSVTTGDYFMIKGSGLVGIGSTTPVSKLTVSGGDAWIDGFAKASYFVGTSTATSTFGGAITVASGMGTSTFAAGLQSGSLSVNGTSTLRDIVPAGPYTGNMSAYNLGTSASRWSNLWAQTVNIGTSTWSLAQTGDRFGVFNAAQSGGTETFSISNGGNVGIGSTTPGLKLSVGGAAYIAGDFTTTGSLKLGTLTGALSASNGTVTGGTLSVANGGTGVTSLSSLPLSGFNNDVGYLTTVAGWNISLLTNDSGYTTTGSNISQFTNDAGYLTSGGSTPGGSSGNIQFNDNGSFAGASSFFWDNSNARLGVNNASPSYTLDVGGDINFSGNLLNNGSQMNVSAFNNDSGYISSISGLNISQLTNDSVFSSLPSMSEDGNGNISIYPVSQVNMLFKDSGSNITATISTDGAASFKNLSLTNLGGDGCLYNSSGVVGATGCAAGSQGYVQFNNGSNNFGASVGLFWDDGTSRLGIYNSSPQYNLDVSGDMNANSYYVATTPGVTCGGDVANSENGIITGCLVSDSRFKENVLDITNILDSIDLLRPVSFTWNDTYKSKYKQSEYTEQIGFIAQELDQVFPSIVNHNADGYLSVQYYKLTAILTEGVKELHTMVKDIQNTLTNIGTYLADKTVHIKETITGTLRIEDKVCVDDVCVTKEQFKDLLINAGAAATPNPTPTPTTEDDSTATSSDPVIQDETNSTTGPDDQIVEEVVPEVVPEPEVTTEPEPSPEPEPEAEPSSESTDSPTE